jgi:hypothetical protein
MLDRPMKRIWPSVMRIARSNTLRHFGGLTNGSSPSITSISANAPTNRSHRLDEGATAYFFFAGTAGAAAPEPRMAWKKSLPGSTIITSFLVRKLAR